ncbi:MAG: OmpA family protein [Deltaproteobacteria bacterium]|nr:OmpA family protein [Deltaproteobacteria bacterium]
MPRHMQWCLMAFLAAAFLAPAVPVAAAEGGASASLSEGVSVDGSGDAAQGPQRLSYRFFNLHLAIGAAFAIGDELKDKDMGEYGGQGTAGMDFVVLDPFALSIRAGYNGFSTGGTRGLEDMFVGAGLRLRLADNGVGPLTADPGDVLGNLWIDAHFAYHTYEYQDHGGYDVGLGYEFSWAEDFNLGPYARFTHVPLGDGIQYKMFAVGLEASLGGKFEPDDRDKDGIEDEKDKCPDQPEDKDGFEDEDGCPDADNDGDGVPDVSDKCPNVAGTRADGCPETDKDHDGIVDDVDKCPNEAEDKDGFEDEDGCPDEDNDGDGIPDVKDKCPNEAEDKDGFEDEDGCPDADNDGDGIPDVKDKCPNEAAPNTPDGCPTMVRVEGDQIKILQKVYFATDKDTILEKSFPVLEQVATVIKGKKGIKVRVEGHTDNKGKPKRNMDLSNRRAASVVKFFTERGIEADRLVSEGFGDTKPIADNKTETGRAENRRVEFHMVPLAVTGAPLASSAPAPAPAPAPATTPTPAPAPAPAPTPAPETPPAPTK